jgi:quercetin dioxygenase-like cupin family protein
MPFVDTSELDVVERKPGWFGRYFDSPSMSFAHYEFTAGSTVQEHSHPQEEVWLVVEGALEITVDGEVRTAGAGVAAIVPPNVRHAVKALTNGKAIVVDFPLRPDAS